jgi:hypothetical protein
VGGMGFRNLSDFNISLLAKQVWRLFSDPTSLCAQVLKGLYYPNCDILSAGKGSRASWAWSSLLEGKGLIVAGARWQVGNGDSIDIWADKWITCSTSGFLHPILPIDQSRPQLVKELIDWNTTSWKLNQIQDLISVEDCQNIEIIPLGDESFEDRLIWPHSMNGQFSVKSGYHQFTTFTLKIALLALSMLTLLIE